MKKILAILLSVMMILTIGACGKKEEQNNSCQNMLHLSGTPERLARSELRNAVLTLD